MTQSDDPASFMASSTHRRADHLTFLTSGELPIDKHGHTLSLSEQPRLINVVPRHLYADTQRQLADSLCA